MSVQRVSAGPRAAALPRRRRRFRTVGILRRDANTDNGDAVKDTPDRLVLAGRTYL